MNKIDDDDFSRFFGDPDAKAEDAQFVRRMCKLLAELPPPDGEIDYAAVARMMREAAGNSESVTDVANERTKPR